MSLVNKILEESGKNIFQPRKVEDREKELKNLVLKNIEKIGKEKFENIWIIKNKFDPSPKEKEYFIYKQFVRANSEKRALKIIYHIFHKIPEIIYITKDLFSELESLANLTEAYLRNDKYTKGAVKFLDGNKNKTTYQIGSVEKKFRVRNESNK